MAKLTNGQVELVASIFAIIGLAWILGLLSGGLRGRARRRNRRWDRHRQAPTRGTASLDLRDPLAQMEAIARVRFHTVRLLNREEARLLPLIESELRDIGGGYRVMAQTSLGEIIEPIGPFDSAENRAAYASINSKRLDFAIFDRAGRLQVAIEYQGSGHYQTRSFMRDAVKREVLRKAGVPFIEIPQGFVVADVRRQIRSLLAARPLPGPRDLDETTGQGNGRAGRP